MKSLAELIAAFRSGGLTLPAVFEALTVRGRIGDEQHRAELATLEQLRGEADVDPQLIRVLAAKLAQLQSAPAADATVVKPAAAAAPADVTQPTATGVVKPVTPTPAPPSSPPSPPADDATVVRARTIVPPAAPRPPADDATVVKPATAVTPPPPGSDATVVKPTGAPPPAAPSPPVADDATVVKPATVRPPVPPPPPTGDVTMVKPATVIPPRPVDPATTSATGTQGATGTNSQSSTWQRVAEATGGDYVTVGSVLKGRFYLDKEIGRGGMGVVYLARDDRKIEARDRDPFVAVKVLNDEFRRHPDSLIALQRESRRSQQLAHDNIVRVYDFDKDGTIVFMTMEYVDGTDLKGLIRDKAYNGLPLKEARPLIDGMARALVRAHGEGVVHSDFKPGNVMVTRSGVPKVFDFGIARAGKGLGAATGEQTVFDAGSLGALTPAYASLEMIQGKDPEPSDDVYALGCVAYELLTGKHPFDKHSAEVSQKEGRKPPIVPGLTKRQQRALAASVAFTRDQRLKSASELVEGLRELSLRERAMPYVITGGPALMLALGAGWAGISYKHTQAVNAVVARFAAGAADRYANEDEAGKALDDLSDSDRKRIVADQSDAIEGYLLALVDAYWNPEQKRHDYAKALRVFALRDRLKMYAPKFDTRRAEVDKQKADFLNTLDTDLTRQIGADLIFENQPDNAVVTLNTIRAIDPESGLLKNAQLELKYDSAIGKSLDAGKVAEAKERLDVANRFFAGSERMKQRAAQIDALGQTLAAQQQKEAAEKAAAQEREQKLSTLSGLLDHPANADDWRSQSADAYRAALKVLEDDPRLAAQAARLKQALLAQVRETQAKDAKAAIDLAGFGIDLFPGDAALSAARQSLIDQQNRLAQAEQTKAQKIDKAKARIADLLAKPANTAVWLQDIKSALAEAKTQLGDTPDYNEARRNVDAGVQKLARDQLAAGAFDDAERIAKAGQQIDPAEAAFGKLVGEVDEARNAAKNKVAQAQAQKLADARKALADLAAKPAFTADWQNAVNAALDQLRADKSPDTQKAIDALGDAIATEAAKLATPQQLPQAKQAVEFGLKLVPKSAKLLEQRAALDKLGRDLQARSDLEAANAEVTSRIESMKSAAAAGDIAKVRESLARIRALQPDNAFAKTEGPALLAGAYLGQAEDLFQKKNWQNAADMVGQGIKLVGDRPEFRGPKARYDLVATIKNAGDGPLSAADYERLRRQLDDARKLDATAFAKMEGDLRARGQLAEKSLADRVDKLKPAAAPAAPAPTPAAPPPVAAPVVVPPPAAPAPAPAAAPPPTRPEAAAKPEGAAPAAAGAGVAVGAGGPDPCAKPELVGKGKACFDAIGERKGPRLVVVPGLDGGAPYALGKYEVSIANYNDYCAASHKCSARPVEDEDLANAPITGIALADAQGYLAWLSSTTGYSYRLPSDAEWSAAAKAGGFKQAEDSNCIAPGATAGSGAAVSPKGRTANPYGLVHMSGNVWEWVGGGKISVRGGSFSEYWSDCTVDARHDDNGQPKKDVGFRVLREIK